MTANPPSPPSVEAIFNQSRTLLIATIAISVISLGITLMACLGAVHYMASADDLPYRLAAGVLVKLAAGACAIGFAGLCGLLAALRPIFRGLAAPAAKSKEAAP